MYCVSVAYFIHGTVIRMCKSAFQKRGSLRNIHLISLLGLHQKDTELILSMAFSRVPQQQHYNHPTAEYK